MLAVFAHPDDEAFGPGGTIAKYGQREDVEIHLLVATKGEAGQWDKKSRIENQELRMKNKEKIQIHDVRAEEVKKSASILGVENVEFMGFEDGTLCNNLYHKVAEKIIKKINAYKPDVILTNERRGVSGHLDHVAISMITTYAFRKTKFGKKLYYHCLEKSFWYDKLMENYFIYFPEGYDSSQITTRIGYSDVNDIKKRAMLAHKSQAEDANRLLLLMKFRKKEDCFILQSYRGVKPKFPEADLFEGIS